MSTKDHEEIYLETIRKALEFGAGWFVRPNPAFQEKSPSKALFDDALAALSRLAEPGEGAQKLAHELHDKCMTLVNPNSLCDYEVELDTTMAAALIERHVAAKVATAREEERNACAERAEKYVKKSYSPKLGVQIIVPEDLIDAIKEAPNES